jgi:hypothetical protein
MSQYNTNGSLLRQLRSQSCYSHTACTHQHYSVKMKSYKTPDLMADTKGEGWSAWDM